MAALIPAGTAAVAAGPEKRFVVGIAAWQHRQTRLAVGRQTQMHSLVGPQRPLRLASWAAPLSRPQFPWVDPLQTHLDQGTLATLVALRTKLGADSAAAGALLGWETAGGHHWPQTAAAVVAQEVRVWRPWYRRGFHARGAWAAAERRTAAPRDHAHWTVL